MIENVGLVSLAIAIFVLSSLVEYWLHRLMHRYPHKCQFHVDHHQENTGQGVLGEFLDYGKVVLPIPALLMAVSWKVGLSVLTGASVYALFAAYAHQLQHDNPTQCFWMRMPVHYVHHKHNQWHHNFGLGVDWWDRVFGTYQPEEWLTAAELTQPQRGLLHVRWW
ncbi:MAG: sterol desaturase family protein [Elainellaceae cyanobacterium]